MKMLRSSFSTSCFSSGGISFGYQRSHVINLIHGFSLVRLLADASIGDEGGEVGTTPTSDAFLSATMMGKKESSFTTRKDSEARDRKQISGRRRAVANIYAHLPSTRPYAKTPPVQFMHRFSFARVSRAPGWRFDDTGYRRAKHLYTLCWED